MRHWAVVLLACSVPALASCRTASLPGPTALPQRPYFRNEFGKTSAEYMLPDCFGFPASLPSILAHMGQTIPLPSGTFTRVHLLAAADGEQRATFRVGDTPVELTIQDWSGYVGQWDNRIWTKNREELVPPRADAPPGTPARTRTVADYAGLTPGFVKRAPVAWFASHRHLSDGSNDPYAYSYLFAYAIDIPAGATSLTLPANPRVRVLAATVSDEAAAIRPVSQLYDALVR